MMVTEIDLLATSEASRGAMRATMESFAIVHDPCPLGGDHDTRGEMVNAAGYSCIKCHKTWDRQWRPTYPESK